MWHIERKYRLFYIKPKENLINTSRLLKKVLAIRVIDPSNKLTSEYVESSIIRLKKGNIITVSLKNFKIKRNMSILEKSCQYSEQYFLYLSNGEFKEIEEKEYEEIMKKEVLER